MAHNLFSIYAKFFILKSRRPYTGILMGKPFLWLFALLLSTVAFSISGSDAVNLVVNSNHFLYEAETYTPPNITIKFEGENYWVVPLTAGSTVVTYFPVDAESGELTASRQVNRGLFQVADNLRSLLLLKSSLKPGSGVEWIFSQKYETIFGEMSLQLSDEVFQLNTVETTLKKEGVEVEVSPLKAQLAKMASDSSLVAKKISVAAKAENDFSTKPSPEGFSETKGYFDDVFSSISSLNDTSLSYKSGLDRLKQQISVANTDAQTKSQLFSILEMPEGLQRLRNYNLDATQIKESINSALLSSSLGIDSLLEEFDKRMLKNEVYDLLYSDNARLKKETGFSSLQDAKLGILSPEARVSWESQPKVRALEQNHARAVKFYDERNFSQARKFALESIDDAVAVHKAGRKKQVLPPLVSQDFLFQAAGILIALLVILYIVNNRGKIKGLVSKEPGGVDIYG